MAAGISQRDMNRKYYRRLKKLQYELESAGVKTIYRRFQLFSGDGAHDGFNICYRTLRASNGETAGLLQVYITSDGPESNPETGIARIKAKFGKQN